MAGVLTKEVAAALGVAARKRSAVLVLDAGPPRRGRGVAGSGMARSARSMGALAWVRPCQETQAGGDEQDQSEEVAHFLGAGE
jgi:hypothetical protein